MFVAEKPPMASLASQAESDVNIEIYFACLAETQKQSCGFRLLETSHIYTLFWANQSANTIVLSGRVWIAKLTMMYEPSFVCNVAIILWLACPMCIYVQAE